MVHRRLLTATIWRGVSLAPQSYVIGWTFKRSSSHVVLVNSFMLQGIPWIWNPSLTWPIPIHLLLQYIQWSHLIYQLYSFLGIYRLLHCRGIDANAPRCLLSETATCGSSQGAQHQGIHVSQRIDPTDLNSSSFLWISILEILGDYQHGTHVLSA